LGGGVGNIRNNIGNNSVVYSVTKLKYLTEVIIPHLIMYSLLTQKRSDFILFKWAVELIQNAEHLSLAGIQKIVALRLKASLNKGLSDELKKAFFKQVERPRAEFLQIPNPNWLAGFVCGEGCFLVGVAKSKFTGYQVRLLFSINQHNRDSQLMGSLVKYLSCGEVYPKLNKSYGEFVVSKFYEIESKIIPFFNKYPIHGDKTKDWDSFQRAAIIIQNKGHLTMEGLGEIRTLRLKEDMNLSRYSSKKDE
jgi:hypothetical protein